MKTNLGIVILAAGLGTRMKSNKAKVLHQIGGRPMIYYVVRTATAVAGANVVVVVGHQAEQVKQVVSGIYDVHYALQAQQRGTGHAVLCALPHLPDDVQEVVVLCGDVPLIRAATIERLVADHIAQQRDVSILAVAVDNPTGYGRLLFDSAGQLTGIVEEADADPAQKKIKIINTGIYVVKRSFLAITLPQIKADNTQQEIYLTDIIGIGYRQNKMIGAVIGADGDEIIGVNSRAELELTDKIMKMRDSEMRGSEKS